MEHLGELEIWIDKQVRDLYTVQLRFHTTDSETDRVTKAEPAELDLAALLDHADDADAYGQCLDHLFEAPEIREGFRSAIAHCEGLGCPLSLRLFVGPGAPELHELRWETFTDGREPGAPLLTREDVHFSRYLASRDWRPVRLKPKRDLRALVAVASPSDLDQYPHLAPIETKVVVERVDRTLGELSITWLTGEGEATLERILDALIDGYDVLYLVAHGTLQRSEPLLWLVKDSGEVERVRGETLASGLRDLGTPPNLAVLASCQSAGTGEVPSPATDGEHWGALAALGPRICAAGVPSVLAMQGHISQETEATFVARFFEQLVEDGRIDRAASMARAAVKRRPDWWMPALFTRLRKCRLWYRTGFGDEERDKDCWPALIERILPPRKRRRSRLKREKIRCAPLLGPGLLEPFVGSFQELAQRLAAEKQFPLASHERDHLSAIAQFIDVKIHPRYLHRHLEELLCQRLVELHGSRLPEDARRDAEEAVDLASLQSALAHRWEEIGRMDPHRALAELDLPLYITTNPDNHLVDVLEAQGKTPQVDIFRWNKGLEFDEECEFERLEDPEPTAESPLVYHLFGHLDSERSLVLSEDDCLDFLTGFSAYRDQVPSPIRAALRDSALIFVGYRPDDLGFRVLMRAIVHRDEEGLPRLSRRPHVAAQLELEEERLIDPENTRAFLNKYMGNVNISLYWGTPETFLKELLDEIERYRKDAV